jgi:hypothetical protein
MPSVSPGIPLKQMKKRASLIFIQVNNTETAAKIIIPRIQLSRAAIYTGKPLETTAKANTPPRALGTA